MVEGQAGLGLVNDSAQHRVQIMQDFDGGNSHGPDSSLVQPCVAGVVAGGPITPFVRLAVHLDRKAGVAAEEIERVGSGWVLPAEFEMLGPRAKDLPEQDLGETHRAAKTTRLPDGAATRPG
jgi:hypothetical protein